jgi:hypothetical protein
MSESDRRSTPNDLEKAVDMLLASAPPHMTHRNAAEREAYRLIRKARAAPTPPAETMAEVAPGHEVPEWLLHAADRIADYMAQHHPGPWSIGRIQSRQTPHNELLHGLTERFRLAARELVQKRQLNKAGKLEGVVYAEDVETLVDVLNALRVVESILRIIDTDVVVRGPDHQRPPWAFTARWNGQHFVTYDPIGPLNKRELQDAAGGAA